MRRWATQRASATKPFAEFDRAKLSVRVLPLLLRQEVAVGAAVLDALRLNLEVTNDGRSNWDDFASADGSDEERRWRSRPIRSQPMGRRSRYRASTSTMPLIVYANRDTGECVHAEQPRT